MGYWLRMPGECGERLSDSVAPEHLRGSCQLSSRRGGGSPVALPRFRLRCRKLQRPLAA